MRNRLKTSYGRFRERRASWGRRAADRNIRLVVGALMAGSAALLLQMITGLGVVLKDWLALWLQWLLPGGTK